MSGGPLETATNSRDDVCEGVVGCWKDDGRGSANIYTYIA